jgi:PAS domain S-box-containing protein
MAKQELIEAGQATALLKALGEISSDAIYAKDVDGRFLYANPTVLAIIGKSADEVLGRADIDFPCDPAQAAVVMDNDRRIMEGGVPEVIEENWTVADLGERTYRSTKTPFYRDDGSLIGLVCLSVDITAARAARETEERSRLILENMSEGVMLFDSDANCIYQNPASLRIQGDAPGRHGKFQRDAPPALYKAWDGAGRPLAFEEWPIARVCRREHFHDQVVRFLRVDTGRQWVASYNGCPFVSADGKLKLGFITIRETSEPILAEEALRESEEQLRLALSAGRMATWRWDLATNACVWNEEHYRILGYEPGSVTPSYQAWAQRVLPEDLAPTEANLRAMVERGVEYVAEYRVLGEKGDVRWMEARGQRQVDKDGRVLSAQGVMVDATNRKLAENALLSSQKQLRAFLENSALVAWLKDKEGRYVFASENYYRRFAWRPESSLGKTDFDMWPRAVAEEFRKNDLAVLAAEAPIEVVEPSPNPDGSMSWWLVNKFHYCDSAGRRFVGGLGVDITERKLAEEALRKSEHRLKRVYDSRLMGVVYWKTNGDVVDANDKFLEMVGYDRADLAAGRINWRHMTPPEFALFGTLEELKATSASSVPFEKEYIRKDGSRVPVLAARAAFDEENGDGVALVIDISARKQAELALALAKAEAERANIAKSKFLAAASHDLRQPVQSLTLLLSAMQRHVMDKPKAANIVAMANASMASLNGMLTGILDISRLDAGVITPDIASVDLSALIDRMAREYGPRAAAVGLDLRHASRVLLARTDAALLERMLRNLIENALRYTPKGGGVLVGVRPRGERVRIDVIDTGIGIPVSQQKEIFEEFRQLNNPARDSSRGLGLGLAIVSRLAGLIGCEIQVASRVGHGTRFSLLLPLEKFAPPAERVAKAINDPGGRILIIEDNASIRQAYEIMLQDWGYETLSAANGEDAINCAAEAKWSFDAIIADHRLGRGLTGNAAAEEIARRAGRSYPTMVVTGDTAEERLAEVFSSGFVLLHKPVDADELRRSLASLLRGLNRPPADAAR